MLLYIVLCALCVTAQAQRVSHKFNNTKLSDALTTLSRESRDYDISFIHNAIEHCKVTTRFSNVTIPEAVQKVTAEQPVKVKQKGRNITVQYKKSRDKYGTIYGQVRNIITREPVIGAKITMLTADSVEISSTILGHLQMIDDYDCWTLKVPLRMSERILRFDMEGYESVSIHIPPATITNKLNLRYIEPVYMRRKAREVMLDEVIVKATKVKFSYRGDTLVYNADAFQLAEGSMLDALIRQLPGAELKDNGQILVNGRVVESLLLNGEDFFKKDRRIMLDNLPSYMVQTVKVYEKQSEYSKAIGRRTGDEPYVMDVHLKRQYNAGWIANVEAGAGSAERWLMRAFALRFTNHSRLSFFANMNNVNEDRRPGETTEWTPQKMPKGRLTRRNVGLDYLSKEKDGGYKFSGDLTVSHDDSDNSSRTSRTDFLPEQNTWTRGETQSRSHDIEIATSHKMYLHTNRYYFANANVDASFRKWKNGDASASATFSENPAMLVADPKALLDSVRAFDDGSMLRRIAVNRYLNDTKREGNNLYANIGADYCLLLNKICTDDLTFRGGATFRRSENKSFSRYRLDYPSTSLAAVDFRNRYDNESPDHSFSYYLSMSYGYWVKGCMGVSGSYSFGQTLSRDDYSTYRLDRLAGFGAGDSIDIGVLPSEAEYAGTIDVQNSFEQTLTDTWHRLVFNFSNGHYKNDDHDFELHIYLPVKWMHTSMDYRRAAYNGRTARNSIFFEPQFKYSRKWHQNQRGFEIRYNMYMTAPDMVRLLDITNDYDPLNITGGNPDLENTTRHLVRLSAFNNSRRKQRSFSTFLKYQHIFNAVAMGYTYNPATGVRHYRPQNVDGNSRLDANVSFSTPIDRAKTLKISTKTDFQCIHSVDLIGIDRTTNGYGTATTASISSTAYAGNETSDDVFAPQRSTVNTLRLTERLNLEYRIGTTAIGLNGTMGWNSSHSRREGFSTTDVYTMNYGSTLKTQLPLGIQLATDLTVYTNRGFADPSANTTDIVWNARLSKRLMGSRLTLSVDAFDILGQLSNITHALNSQGLTETWHNSLPRYIMAHVTWRLNKEPKKF